MSEPTIDTISHDEFENVLQEHVVWASKWDGTMVARDFFGVWADLQRPKEPLQLKAQITEGQLTITAPPESSVKVVNNHIYLENGLELIISLA